ncbi:MAG: hypothetical protein ACI4TF_09540 [Oliverpabstia sp.]
MKQTKDDILRYRFTKYVEVSVRRARNHYWEKECYREEKEWVTDPELVEDPELDWVNAWKEERCFDPNFLEAGNIRAYLGEQIDGQLWRALSSLTDRQIVLLYARLFVGLTFKEIEDLTGMDKRLAGSSYAYTLKKLRKGVEKNEL